MERQLEEKMEDIMSRPGVVGAMCVDKRGLVLSAKGVAPPTMGGILSSLASGGRQLEASSTMATPTTTPTPPNTSSSSPIIRLESEQGYCLVQRKGDVTLGVFKTLDERGVTPSPPPPFLRTPSPTSTPRGTPTPTSTPSRSPGPGPQPHPLSTSTTTTTSPDWEDSSSSSDDAEMAGSPKRSRAERRARNTKPDTILEGSVKSASYNIVFQVLTRVFTFALNAFILRYVSHEVLGLCNVRLALLTSSVMFLSREPFRRAVLRKRDSDSWRDTVNLIWLVVPNTAFWALLFGYAWCYLLSNPGPDPTSSVATQYRASVWWIVSALIVDSFVEVPYIVGQYFLFARLRIVGDTTLILVRSLALLVAVIYYPSSAVAGYAIGSLIGVVTVGGVYYSYFYYHIVLLGRRDIPFQGLRDFFPKPPLTFPWELASLAWSFFKQGILKQLLTEGERYLMTFFDLLAFHEQGVYDLVANLGSLAARFIFLPVEEGAYFYFAQTLERRPAFTRRERKLAQSTAQVLGNLVKVMVLIGVIMITYGIPYSNTLLYLYGGEGLSERGPGTRLLQANCAYIFIMGLNGVTEAFTFAAMTQVQMDKFNRRLLSFSIVVLGASYIFTRLFGSVGFFLANSVNMGLRVGQSVMLIRTVFQSSDTNPFEFWKLRKRVVLYFVAAFILIQLFTTFIYINRSVHVLFGLVVFGGNCAAIYHFDKELIQFWVKMFKSKSV